MNDDVTQLIETLRPYAVRLLDSDIFPWFVMGIVCMYGALQFLKSVIELERMKSQRATAETTTREFTDDDEEEPDLQDQLDAANTERSRLAISNARLMRERDQLSDRLIKLAQATEQERPMPRAKHIIVCNAASVPLNGAPASVSVMAFDDLLAATEEAQRRTRDQTVEIYTLYARTRLPVPDIKVDEVAATEDEE